jgi:hypothetical protein
MLGYKESSKATHAYSFVKRYPPVLRKLVVRFSGVHVSKGNIYFDPLALRRLAR